MMRASTLFALLSISALVAGRPGRPYAVVNVDGQGSPPPAATTSPAVQDAPAAGANTNKPPTAAVTDVPLQSQATPAASTMSTVVVTQPSITQAVVVTVTTTATPAPTPTEYYDNGLWHTYYVKKPETTGSAIRGNSTAPLAKAKRTSFVRVK